MKEILFYSNKQEYGWLSNFERVTQVVDGIVYPTNEHYYQSQKALNENVQKWIQSAPSPYLAMIAGRGLREKEMVDDWENKKLNIMRNGLWAKFSQNNEIGNKLLMTGDAILHEDSPTDKFWGIKGADWLGKLIIEVREKLKIEKTKINNVSTLLN